MAGQRKIHGTGCPVAFSLDTFGDRWTLLVVRDMIMLGSRSFGEFIGAGEGIATNILADRLKHLEAQGIVSKERDPDNKRKNIYSLTEKGMDLIPVIMEAIRWGGTHDTGTRVPQAVIDRIENDREAFAAELRDRLSQQ